MPSRLTDEKIGGLGKAGEKTGTTGRIGAGSSPIPNRGTVGFGRFWEEVVLTNHN